MSAVSSIPTLLTPPSSSSQISTSGSSGTTPLLTQQQFLQLITAQLSNQDPLDTSSTDPTQMVNQFMSLGNFEATQSVATNQSRILGQSLIGANVTLTNTTDTGVNSTVNGTVSSTSVDQNGNITITVNGQSYSSASIISVNQPAATPAPTGS